MAHVVVSTGQTWDEVEDNLTFPRLQALKRYWRKFPPTHILVAGAVGHKPPPDTEEKPQDIGDLFAMFPGGRMNHG